MYAASRHVTGILVDAITEGPPLEPTVYEDLVLVAQRHHRKQLDATVRTYDTVFGHLCI